MDEVYRVKKMDTPIHWVTEVPGSKSITNRALLMAALSNGKVTLHGVLFSDDSRYFLRSLQSLGFELKISEEKREVVVCGCSGRIPNETGEIYVGSAGTAARFLTAMLGVSAGTYIIQASEQMQKRPMKPLFEALLSLGAKINWLGEPWHLPIQIKGAKACKEDASMASGTRAENRYAKERELHLDIRESTQFLSAFLLVSPMFCEGLHIHITSQKTDGSYIRITRRMMADFGVHVIFDGRDYTVGAGAAYQKSEYRIEPDVSAACYFYAAAAVTGGYAKVLHVHPDGLQGDLKFLSVLKQMGCNVCEEADGISVRGAGVFDDLCSFQQECARTGCQGRMLHGLSVNMNDFSDQALTLAAIAPYADSPIEIRGIGHIRGQECDRICAIVSNLTRAGISCEEYLDGVKIYPGQPKPCRIKTFDDHRVAMAFSVMGLGTKGIEIENPMCCKKTFENYFDVLDKLSAD